LYAVKSIGVEGESDFSETAKGFAGIIEEAIGVPKDLEGLFSEDAVYLTWNQVSQIDGYNIYRFNQSQENYLRVGKTKDTHFREKKQFVDGEVLWYIITAYRGDKESKPSQAFSITVVLPQEEVTIKELAVPSNFKASEEEYADLIKVSWDAVEGADDYLLYKWNDEKEEWYLLTETAATFYDDKDLAEPIAYYTVQARNQDTTSEFSSAAMGTVTGHDVEIIDEDAEYADEEYIDETEFEDTDYTDEDLYDDDTEYVEEDIIFDDFEDEVVVDEKEDIAEEEDIELDTETTFEVTPEEEMLDDLRDKVDTKDEESASSEADEKTAEEKENEDRAKDLIRESDDDDFFDSDDDFFDSNDDFFDSDDDFFK